jgi:hypothetical protein
MGQQKSSLYSHSAPIEDLIRTDTWQTCESKQTFNLSQNTFENPGKHKYTIKLKSDIPSNCNMCILFPNHPLQKKRILWTKSYLGHLNQFSTELNDRIQKCNRDNLSIWVSCGNGFFEFQKFVGNIYLFWAETVNIQSVNQFQNVILKDVPLIIETNGQMSNRSLFVFQEENGIIINLQDVNLQEPIGIYCCDTDFRRDTQKMIVTLSDRKANQIVEDLVLRRLRELSEDELPFVDEETQFEVVTDRIPQYLGENPEVADEF